MQKKLLGLGLGLVAVVSLVGCGPKTQENDWSISVSEDGMFSSNGGGAMSEEEFMKMQQENGGEPVVEKKDTLESLLKANGVYEGIKEGLEQMAKEPDSKYSKVEYEVHDNYVFVSYYFADQMSEEGIAAINDDEEMDEKLKEQAIQMLDGYAKQLKFNEAMEVTFEFYNADGSLVYSYSYNNAQ